MRFLIDNALSVRVAERLCDEGHDAIHVRDLGLGAAPDEAIFDRALPDARVIVSADTDFGTLLALRQSTAPSVILFRRGASLRPKQQAALLVANLPAVSNELLAGCVVIIDRIVYAFDFFQSARSQLLPIPSVRKGRCGSSEPHSARSAAARPWVSA